MKISRSASPRPLGPWSWQLPLIALALALLPSCGEGPVGAADGEGPIGTAEEAVRAQGARLAGTISVGFDTRCVLLSDGTVNCWGQNMDGNVGDGTTIARTSPTQVSNLTNAVAVSAGDGNCALRSNGTVSCWGSNSNGDVGDGTTTQRLVPTLVSGISTAVAISAGTSGSACALLAGGTVQCWGLGDTGQLGDGNTANHKALTPVTAIGITNAIGISTGSGNNRCAILSNGTLKCWGSNGQCQLGDGTTTNRGTPVAISSVSDVVQVAGGTSHMCALVVGGAVKCWGDNTVGQLGNTTTVDSCSPVTTIASGAVSISSNSGTTCAILSDGGAKCWGAGHIGNGSTATALTPTTPYLFQNPREISVGTLDTCAVLEQGIVNCWGGQTGSTSPTFISGFTAAPSNQFQIASGAEHTCGLLPNGSVKCWGYNGNGELGDGTTISRSSAVTVSGVSTAVSICAGTGYSCALLDNGTVKCWGLNSYGELGNGTTTGMGPSTVGLSTSEPAVAIACGGYHACAQTSIGRVECWGNNTWGQLGDLTTTSRSTPAAAHNVLNYATGIVAGNGHTCIRLANGTAKCWGRNNIGQLGDGTTTNRTQATLVTGLSGVDRLAAGLDHTCTRLYNGTAKCWGANVTGQLGNGTTTSPILTPTLVSPLSSAVTVAGGVAHTCALKSDGTATCWGRNSLGQLGDGTTVNHLTPGAIVSSLSGITALSGGQDFTCALKYDGTAWCWGDDWSVGVLGHGSLVGSSSVPLQVASFP